MLRCREKHTTLSAVTEQLQFKTEHNFSEKAFNDLLPLIKEFLPADNNLPGSSDDMKQLAKKLNLRYENIDAEGAADLGEETYQRIFDAIHQRVRAKQENNVVIEAVRDLIWPGGSRFDDLFRIVLHEMNQEIYRTFAEFSRNDIGSYPSQESGLHSSQHSGSNSSRYSGSHSSQDSVDDYDDDPDYASGA